MTVVRREPLCRCQKCRERRRGEVAKRAAVKHIRDKPKRVEAAKEWLDELAMGPPKKDVISASFPSPPRHGQIVKVGGRPYIFDGLSWRPYR